MRVYLDRDNNDDFNRKSRSPFLEVHIKKSEINALVAEKLSIIKDKALSSLVDGSN